MTPEAMTALSKLNITGLELNGLTELTGDLGGHIANILDSVLQGISCCPSMVQPLLNQHFLDAMVAIKGQRFGLRFNGLQQMSSETTAALGRLHVN